MAEAQRTYEEETAAAWAEAYEERHRIVDTRPGREGETYVPDTTNPRQDTSPRPVPELDSSGQPWRITADGRHVGTHNGQGYCLEWLPVDERRERTAPESVTDVAPEPVTARDTSRDDPRTRGSSLGSDAADAAPGSGERDELDIAPGQLAFGGKGGNQAAAGAEVTMIGRVGDDESGRRLRANLAVRGIDVSQVLVTRAAAAAPPRSRSTAAETISSSSIRVRTVSFVPKTSVAAL